MFMDGTKDLTKAEEMYMIALDSYEKSLGKDYEDTKVSARNLAILLETIGTRKIDLRKVLGDFSHLEQAESWSD